MGSRVLPVLLFAIACLAGGLYWISKGEAARESVRGAPAPAPLAPAPSSALLDRPAERVGGLEDVGARPAARTSVPEPAAAPDPLAASRATGPAVRGRVLDRDGGPIAGAQVLASDEANGLPPDLLLLDGVPSQRREATTDADGRFELSGLGHGTARFAVRASGYAPYDDRDVALPAGGDVELDPFLLSRGAILSGRVVGPDGRPVAGARLSIEDPERGFGMVFLGSARRPDAETGSDGTFRLDRLACGKWRVRVASDEHPARTFEGLAERPGEEHSGLEFRLGEGVAIAGRLSGAPIEELGELFISARAARNGDLESLASLGEVRTAEPNDDGTFELRGLEPETDYLLEARSNDGDSFSIFGGRSRSDQVRARSGQRDVELRYQEGSTVTFRVLDARTREPITGFDVRYGIDFLQPLRDEDGKVLREHPEGFARIDRLRLPSDDHRLQLEIQATGYEDFRRDDLALLHGQVLELGRIFLEPVPVLSVRVVDRDSQAPIAGARVSLAEVRQPGMRVEHRISIGAGAGEDEGIGLTDAAPSARTDEQGVARLTCPEGQERSIKVEAPGYAAYASETIYFTPREDQQHLARLGPGGSVLVHVLSSDGTPLAGGRVEHRSPEDLTSGAFSMGGQDRERVSDSKGELRFGNLETGLHAFRLQEESGPGGFFAGEASFEIVGMPAAGEDDWVEVEVVDGEETLVELVASPRGTLEGRVDEAGAPLAGASLSLVDEEEAAGPMRGMVLPGMDGGPRAKSDGRGKYLFEDVKAGRYLLRVEHPKRHMPEEFPVVVREGSNRLDVDLPVTIIEGRVTGADGQALAGLRVSATKAQPTGQTMRFMMIMDTGGGDTVVSGGEDLSADSVLTDAEGRYTLRGVSSGVELVVKAEGKEVQEGNSEKVQLAPGEVRRGVDFACQPAGSIEVEALLADGAPARFCSVRASYQGDEQGVRPEFAFLESGSTTLNGLRPGPWLVSVEKQGLGEGDTGGAAERTVEVVAGQTVHETIQLD